MKPKAYSYIRFSTPEQLKGDSLRRQKELSKNYAKEHGLELDGSLKADKGLSAFKGDHIERGAFGKFLELVKKGRVPKGSYLLVESLDRLSRQKPRAALVQFLNLIEAGITIVTLLDGKVHSGETLDDNNYQIMESFGVMSRAFEESNTKSRRLANAWKDKRTDIAQGKILTERIPAWLRVSWVNKAKNVREGRFEEIPERAKIIRRIFKMYLDGQGAIVICKQLNSEGIEPWGRSKTGWHTSYVKKILKNSAVIGKFQPHRKVDGKRIPVGSNPIDGYYPRIIDSSTFYQVQQRLASNTRYKGQTGAVRNLFGYIAKCAICGASMAYINKGKPPRGGYYLVCDAARRGNGCHYKSVRYEPLEKGIIDYFLNRDADELLSGKDERNAQTIALRGELAGIDGELEDVERAISNIMRRSAADDDPRNDQLYRKELSEQQDRKEPIMARRAVVQHKLSTVEQIETATASQLSDIRELHEHMATLKGDKLKQLRLRLRARVRELIERIDVYPYGFEGDESETPKCIIRFKAGHMAVVSIHPNIIRVHGPK